AAARDALRPRVPGDVDDRLGQDRAADRRRAFPLAEHRQHASHAHPAQDEHEVECGADALRHRASPGRLARNRERALFLAVVETTTVRWSVFRYPRRKTTRSITDLATQNDPSGEPHGIHARRPANDA